MEGTQEQASPLRLAEHGAGNIVPTMSIDASAIIPLFKETWSEFQRKNVQWLAAALAYFTAFAIAPLIIVLVALAGLILGGHQAALNEIFRYLKQDAGSGSGAIQSIVQSTFNQRHSGTVAEIVAWVVLLLAAIGLFNALQFALNTIWEAKPQRSGIREAIVQRSWAFLAILAVAVLLLVSIGLNAGLTVMAAALVHVSPIFPTLMKIADFVISFGVLWVAFAFVFEFLPESRIEWRDVWVGSAVTSLLFVIGQFLLGWYLGRTAVSSGYGAFGSLVVFLIWVNYSAQICLFGATLTYVYSRKYGSNQDRALKGEIPARARTAQRI